MYSIGQKELFIFGEPSTQKTLVINFSAKVISIYFASAMKNAFAGAHDFYDMWIWDEFHEFKLSEKNTGENKEQERGSTVEGAASVNIMLKVLDGQKCRLDCKYSKIFLKKTQNYYFKQAASTYGGPYSLQDQV